MHHEPGLGTDQNQIYSDHHEDPCVNLNCKSYTLDDCVNCIDRKDYFGPKDPIESWDELDDEWAEVDDEFEESWPDEYK